MADTAAVALETLYADMARHQFGADVPAAVRRQVGDEEHPNLDARGAAFVADLRALEACHGILLGYDADYGCYVVRDHTPAEADRQRYSLDRSTGEGAGPP